MKKIVFIVLLAITLQIEAQEQTNWITDYKHALIQSEHQNKPILAFITDNKDSEALNTLNKNFFSTEIFRTIATKVILLKLDVSDKASYNARLGMHYLNRRSAIGLALVNKDNNVIEHPITDITSKNMTSFIHFINSKL